MWTYFLDQERRSDVVRVAQLLAIQMLVQSVIGHLGSQIRAGRRAHGQLCYQRALLLLKLLNELLELQVLSFLFKESFAE